MRCFVLSCGNCYKYYRKHGKYKSLDEAYESFQKKERRGHKIGNKKRDDDEKHFSGENVSEKPEWKRDHLGDFRNEFEYAYEELDWTLKVEKLCGMRKKTDGRHSEDVHGDYCYHG